MLATLGDRDCILVLEGRGKRKKSSYIPGCGNCHGVPGFSSSRYMHRIGSSGTRSDAGHDFSSVN